MVQFIVYTPRLRSGASPTIGTRIAAARGARVDEARVRPYHLPLLSKDELIMDKLDLLDRFDPITLEIWA